MNKHKSGFADSVVRFQENMDVETRQSMILGSSIIEVSQHMYRREGTIDLE